MVVTFNLTGPFCPMCKAPEDGDHWTCGTRKCSRDDLSLMAWEATHRSAECERRGWECVWAACGDVGRKIVEERERRILDAILPNLDD